MVGWAFSAVFEHENGRQQNRTREKKKKLGSLRMDRLLTLLMARGGGGNIILGLSKILTLKVA